MTRDLHPRAPRPVPTPRDPRSATVFAGLTQGLAQLPADALDAIVVQLPARARDRTTGGAELQRAVARFRHLEHCELPAVYPNSAHRG